MHVIWSTDLMLSRCMADLIQSTIHKAGCLDTLQSAKLYTMALLEPRNFKLLLTKKGSDVLILDILEFPERYGRPGDRLEFTFPQELNRKMLCLGGDGREGKALERRLHRWLGTAIEEVSTTNKVQIIAMVKFDIELCLPREIQPHLGAALNRIQQFESTGSVVRQKFFEHPLKIASISVGFDNYKLLFTKIENDFVVLDLVNIGKEHDAELIAAVERCKEKLKHELSTVDEPNWIGSRCHPYGPR